MPDPHDPAAQQTAGFLDNKACSEVVLTRFDEEAVTRAARKCRESVGGTVSVVFAFVSPDWRPHIEEFLEIVRVEGHAPLVLGCSADGLIGAGEEDEDTSGFSLLFLHLPGTRLEEFRFSQPDIDRFPSGDAWRSAAGVDPGDLAAWLVLMNPLEVRADLWIDAWNGAYPGVPCLGGLASGGNTPEEIFLFRNGRIVEDGALALGLSGGVKVEPLVSQGCRPIGEPYTITNARQNVLVEVGSKPAYEILGEAFASLDEEEQHEAQGNIFVGLAVSEYLDNFKRGDFVVRNIIGGDPNSGALMVAAFPRVGQTLQFQFRDKGGADRDLRRQLENLTTRIDSPFGALLFTCTGRGRHLFGVPNHDAELLQQAFGKIPLAGFFCNGEFGPVGGENFIHGYTASAALLLNA